MDLVKTLNRLGKDVMQKYPLINYGGCCVYASMVSIELRKKGIAARGIVSSYYAETCDTTIDEARKKVRENNVFEWNSNGINFFHVGLEFDYKGKTRHYDSTGVCVAKKKLDKMPIYAGRLTHAELKALASKQDGWNSRFDRKNIPALRKLVRSYFENVTV